MWLEQMCMERCEVGVAGQAHRLRGNPPPTPLHTGPSPLPRTNKTASAPGLRLCCSGRRGRRLALTLAHSVSLSGGQLMGERTSTAPRGVLLQWWRVQSAIQDAPGWRAQKLVVGTCGQTDGLSELLEYSSKGRCKPGPGTARNPVCTQPWTLVLVSPPETSS